MIKTKNAIIKGCHWCTERGLTLFVDLQYEHSCQAFGGYRLYSEADNANYCGYFISRLFDVVGVSDLGQLPGKAVRVVADNSHVHQIGNIVEDKWFNPGEEFAELREAKEQA